MAITTEEVKAAADLIAAKTGKTPTVAAVRAQLGTGSFSTITPILREWTEAQAPPTVAASPAEPAPQSVIDCLAAVAPQVWTIAADLANEHLASERTAMDLERAELQSALADSSATGEIIAADLETAQAQVATLTATIATLKTDHAAALEEQTAARITAEQAAAVLRATNGQMQTRVDELHSLNNDLTATVAGLRTDLAAAQGTIASLTIDHAAAITTLKDTHAVTLHEQTAARSAAERDAAVLQATSEQQQIRLAEQQDHNADLTATIAGLKADQAAALAQIADLEANHAAQVAATHAAENRTAAAEATAAAQASQIADLQATVEQLRADLSAIRATTINQG